MRGLSCASLVFFKWTVKHLISLIFFREEDFDLLCVNMPIGHMDQHVNGSAAPIRKKARTNHGSRHDHSRHGLYSNLLAKFLRFWIFTFELYAKFIWKNVLRPVLAKIKRRLMRFISEHDVFASSFLQFCWRCICAVLFKVLFNPSKPGMSGHVHTSNCGYCFIRRCFLRSVAVGPVPQHVAFIMDGNRRFARQNGLKMGSGHYAGFMSLLTVMDVCNEMGIKYVTFYAFSIDNFRRKPEFVSFLFKVLEEKLDFLCKNRELLLSLGVKFNFVGDMKLMPKNIQSLAKTVSELTKDSNGVVLSLVVAYTSTDEIARATQESCREKLIANQRQKFEEACDANVTVKDVEKHMYFYKAGLPDADILVRSSGETRLSNYLLWQTTNCLLVSTDELWPEMSEKTMIKTVLEYQRVHAYLKRKKDLIPTK